MSVEYWSGSTRFFRQAINWSQDATHGTAVNIVSVHPFGAPAGATIPPYNA